MPSFLLLEVNGEEVAGPCALDFGSPAMVDHLTIRQHSAQGQSLAVLILRLVGSLVCAIAFFLNIGERAFMVPFLASLGLAILRSHLLDLLALLFKRWLVLLVLARYKHHITGRRRRLDVLDLRPRPIRPSQVCVLGTSFAGIS